LVDQLLIDIVAYGHVLAAMGWLGGAMLTTFVIGPVAQKLSPGASLELNTKLLPKVLRFMQIAIGSALLFGILLVFVVGGDLTPTQTEEIYAGVFLAVVVAIDAFAITIPSFRRVVKISKEAVQTGQPPSPDIAKYAKRASMGSLIGTLILFAILAMMVASGFS
jgi:uncharacterized membrane protein